MLFLLRFMRRSRLRASVYGAVAVAVIDVRAATGQELAVGDDGALSEITIVGQSGRRQFQAPGTVQHIDEADIRAVAPVSVSDALVLAPAAGIFPATAFRCPGMPICRSTRSARICAATPIPKRIISI